MTSVRKFYSFRKKAGETSLEAAFYGDWHNFCILLRIDQAHRTRTTMHNRITSFLAVLLFTSWAGTAGATPVVYKNQADWLAALGSASVQTEDFESSPVGDLAVGTTDIGLFNITIDPNNSLGNNGIRDGIPMPDVDEFGSRHFEGLHGISKTIGSPAG
ncbi:MAG: hypothetical protein O7F73_14440, partial [Gammaproteobacteria bacterium]|nr:hypothetical protein [Gammaproteobacteria bacterium]